MSNIFNLSIDSTNADYLKKHFLSRLYFYYINNGYYNIISNQLNNIFTGLFIVFYTLFLFNCVDWYTLCTLNSEKHLSQMIHFNNMFNINVFVSILFIIYIFIVFCKLYSLANDIVDFKNIKKYYNTHLDIHDTKLSTLKWNTIIESFKNYNNDNSINIYYINSKIAIKDNYFITLIDKDKLKLNYLNDLMQWNIQYCFIHSMFTHDVHYNKQFLELDNQFIIDIKKKTQFVALANFIFMPFILIYIFFFNLFKYGERFYNKPKLLFSKHWTKMAKWKFRNYNELYHDFHDKMLISYPACNEYSEQLPHKILEPFSKLIVFILSAFFIVLVCISIINEHILLKLYIVDTKSTIWFLGVFASIITVFNSFIKEKIIYNPKEKMKEIKKIINSIPEEWINDDDKNEFSIYYQYRIITIFKEIIYTLIIPFELFRISLDTKDILNFLNEITVNTPENGYMNVYAVFNSVISNRDPKTLDSIETFRKNNPEY
jgi:autophagy-related protein 9